MDLAAPPKACAPPLTPEASATASAAAAVFLAAPLATGLAIAVAAEAAVPPSLAPRSPVAAPPPSNLLASIPDSLIIFIAIIEQATNSTICIPLICMASLIAFISLLFMAPSKSPCCSRAFFINSKAVTMTTPSITKRKNTFSSIPQPVFVYFAVILNGQLAIKSGKRQQMMHK